MEWIKDIPNCQSFTKIEPILKGWSTDEKYYIETHDQQKLLLRISHISQYEKKQAEFKVMNQIAALGIPMTKPLSFGLCLNGKRVYTLLTWCEGEDAETVLPRLSEKAQYRLGLQAGRLLKKLHTLPAPKEQEEWSSRFNRKATNKIEQYKSCEVQLEKGYLLIDYLENNRPLLSFRPQCYHHGDFHVGNLIVSPEKNLFVIDFNRLDYGDPWEEFNRIVWSAAVSPPFATGQINGYFNGKPPLDFFKLMLFYIASNTLSSIPWSIPFGEEEILTMKNQAKDVLIWFDEMKHPIPTWYLENLIDSFPGFQFPGAAQW